MIFQVANGCAQMPAEVRGMSASDFFALATAHVKDTEAKFKLQAALAGVRV